MSRNNSLYSSTGCNTHRHVDCNSIYTLKNNYYIKYYHVPDTIGCTTFKATLLPYSIKYVAHTRKYLSQVALDETETVSQEEWQMYHCQASTVGLAQLCPVQWCLPQEGS